jgi:hypothetical protein
LISEKRPSTRRINFSPILLSVIGASLLLLLLAGEISAADWRIYAGTDEGQFYYDAESVAHPADGVVHLRHKANFSENGVRRIAEAFGKEYEDLAYSISVREINCSERKIRSLGVTYFSKTGKSLDAAVDSRTEWHPIEPTAVIEGLYQMVCKE